MGIVVPMVKTASEARQIVAATRYPPQGARSFGGLRASHYTFDNEDYFNRANNEILVMLILETREGVDNLEEIIAVPGVDVIFLGTMDLCLALGLNPLRQPYPEIQKILERALALGRQKGVSIGIGANSPEQVRERQAEGFHFLVYSGDYQMLAGAAREGLAAFQVVRMRSRSSAAFTLIHIQVATINAFFGDRGLKKPTVWKSADRGYQKCDKTSSP
jgi:4-hydroxy-2-oxoheptanedioate aldolase